MAKIDAAKTWTLNYRLLMAVITEVGAELESLGLDSSKSLFLLAEVDAHPYPAELAALLLMPRPTVTVAIKRLEADGFLKRQIDASDLRRHRLQLTPAGRKVTQRGLALLSKAFAARLARLSAAEQATLHSLLERMI